MGRTQSYFYLIDNLNNEKGELIRNSLMALSDVTDVRYSVRESIIEVRTSRDVEQQLRMACEMNGAGLRTKVNKKDIYS